MLAVTAASLTTLGIANGPATADGTPFTFLNEQFTGSFPPSGWASTSVDLSNNSAPISGVWGASCPAVAPAPTSSCFAEATLTSTSQVESTLEWAPSPNNGIPANLQNPVLSFYSDFSSNDPNDSNTGDQLNIDQGAPHSEGGENCGSACPKLLTTVTGDANGVPTLHSEIPLTSSLLPITFDWRSFGNDATNPLKSWGITDVTITGTIANTTYTLTAGPTEATPTTKAGTTITIPLTGSSDPTGDALNFTITSEPTIGSLSAITQVDATDATLKYTSPIASCPDPIGPGGASDVCIDSFSYAVSDLSGTTSATPVTQHVELTPGGSGGEQITLNAPVNTQYTLLNSPFSSTNPTEGADLAGAVTVGPANFPDEIELKILVSEGNLDLENAGTSGVTFADGTTSTGTQIHLEGSAAQINQALAEFVYFPPSGTPEETINYTTIDEGPVGNGPFTTLSAGSTVVEAIVNNPPPTLTLPTGHLAIANNAGLLHFPAGAATGFSLTDPVANASTQDTVNLQVSSGALGLPASDTSGPSAIVTAVSSNLGQTLALTGTVANLNTALADLTFDASNLPSGNVTLTATASDPNQTSGNAPASVTIAVTQAPFAFGATSISTLENVPTTVFLCADGPQGDPLTFTSFVQPANGILEPDPDMSDAGSGCTQTATAEAFIYTPKTSYVGGDSFSYVVHDSTTNLDSAVNPVTITVTAPDKPSAFGTTASTKEDVPVTFVLCGMNPNPTAPLAFSISTPPTLGTVTQDGPAPINTCDNPNEVAVDFTYTPSPGTFTQDGVDTFAYTVDNGVASDPASVTVTVTTQTPQAFPETLSVPEDGAVGFVLCGTAPSFNFKFNILGPNNGTLDTKQSSNMLQTCPSGDFAEESHTYAPNNFFVGPDTIMYSVTSGNYTSPVVAIHITVTHINIAPVANSQTVNDIGPNPVAITLTATSGQGAPLTYTVAQSPRDGTLSGTAPNLTYTPNLTEGTDTFTFVANNGEGDSIPATVTININTPNFTTSVCIPGSTEIAPDEFNCQSVPSQVPDGSGGQISLVRASGVRDALTDLQVIVTNDTLLSDTVTITAPAGADPWSILYDEDGQDVTSQITGSGLTLSMGPVGSSTGTVYIRVIVVSPHTFPASPTQRFTVTATSGLSPTISSSIPVEVVDGTTLPQITLAQSDGSGAVQSPGDLTVSPTIFAGGPSGSAFIEPGLTGNGDNTVAVHVEVPQGSTPAVGVKFFMGTTDVTTTVETGSVTLYCASGGCNRIQAVFTPQAGSGGLGILVEETSTIDGQSALGGISVPFASQIGPDLYVPQPNIGINIFEPVPVTEIAQHLVAQSTTGTQLVILSNNGDVTDTFDVTAGITVASSDSSTITITGQVEHLGQEGPVVDVTQKLTNPGATPYQVTLASGDDELLEISDAAGPVAGLTPPVVVLHANSTLDSTKVDSFEVKFPTYVSLPPLISSTTATFAGSSLNFGDSGILGASVAMVGGPNNNPSFGTITYTQSGSNTPLTCSGTGESNPTPVSSTGAAGTCTIDPHVGATYVATYSGDAEAFGSAGTVSPTVLSTPTTTSLSINPSDATDYDTPFTLTATIANGSSTGKAPTEPVTFQAEATGTSTFTTITACQSVIPTPVDANTSTASCVLMANSPFVVGSQLFTATSCASFAVPVVTCSDFAESASDTVAYSVTGDPTTVTLSSSVSGVVTAGTPVPVTATVADTVGNATFTNGTVSFTDNGVAIAGCAAVAVTSTGPSSGTALCTFVPTSGSVNISATYSVQAGANNLGSTSTKPLTFTTSGDATTTSVAIEAAGGGALTGPATFGQALELSAAVTDTTSVSTAVNEGTVSFTIDGNAPTRNGSPICQSVAVSATGIATCLLNAPAGTGTGAGHAVVATYSDQVGTGFSGSASPTTTLAVKAEGTGTSIAAQAAAAQGMAQLTAVVSDSDTGETVSPAGTVSFADNGSAIASCTNVALVDPSPENGSASAVCTLASPASPEPFTASFTPTSSSNFSASTSTPTSYPPSASCSTSFAAIWTAVGSNGNALTFTVPGTNDSVSVQPAAVQGLCDGTKPLQFTSGSMALFGQTLTSGAGAFSGFISSTSDGSTLCVNGGTLDLPAAWGFQPFMLSSAIGGNDICFAITSYGTSSGVLGAATTVNLALNDVQLPFSAPDSSIAYSLKATINVATTPPQLVVTVTPTDGIPVSAAYVQATVTVNIAGSTSSAVGTLTLGNIGLNFSQPLTLAFTVSGGANGSIAGSVSSTLIDSGSPYQLVTGVQLENLQFSLSSMFGLTGTASALLGSAPNTASVSVSGGYKAGTWNLKVSGTTPAWTPIAGLTFAPTFTGTIVSPNKGATTYDVEAGTPVSTATASPTPLATWSPTPGATLSLDCIALASGITPSCGNNGSGGGSGSTPTDPTLSMQAALTLGAPGQFSVGMSGSVDLKTSAYALALDLATTANTIIVVTGLSVTVDSFTVGGGAGSPVTIMGKASAQISALGSQPVTVTISDTAGQLVVGALVTDLTGIGFPSGITGFFAYATGATSYVTANSTLGTVKLSPGFNVDAVDTLSPAVASALSTAGINVGAGSTLLFSGSWAPGATPAFSAVVTPRTGYAVLSLPDGGSITSAALTLSGGTFQVTLKGTIPVPDFPAAAVTFTIAVTSTGTFTGTGTVTGLYVFGVNVGLTGSIAYNGSTVTGSLTTCQPQSNGSCTPGAIAGPFTPFSTVPVQFTNVAISLGTTGLQASGSMSVVAGSSGIGSLTFSGSLQSSQNFTLTVTGSSGQSFTPVPGITFTPKFSGTITDKSGAIGFTLAATGSPLFSLNEDGGAFVLTITSVQLGDAAPPTGCTVAKTGDVYLSISGTAALKVLGLTGSTSAVGCFDLTASQFSASATLNGLAFSAGSGAVTLNAVSVSLSEVAGKTQVVINAPLTAKIPGAGTITVNAALSFPSAGGFVAGAVVNLSSIFGAPGNSASLYYASQAVNGFVTGSSTLGTINLPQGLDFALSLNLPGAVTSGLSAIGIHFSSPAGLVAVGNLNFSTGAISFNIAINIGGVGATLFSDNGTSLVLNSANLTVAFSSAGGSFGLAVTTTLNAASITNGAAGVSSTPLTGSISFGTSGVVFALSLGNCNGSSTGWANAFGDQGLNIKCADLTGGIAADGLPNIGLDGTIIGLPSSVANAIGYMSPAPITFAFNLNPIVLDLSIGTNGSSAVALEPLAAYGEGSVLQVNYASLYIAPVGGTIGGTTYPSGLGLNFQGNVEGTTIAVQAGIGLSPPSIYFKGSVGSITLGGVTIGPVTEIISASTSPPSFDFEFDGTLNLGPGTANLGPDLQVGGSLSASVQVNVGTGGFSAFMEGSVSVSVGTQAPTAVCYAGGFFPYPCDWEWEWEYSTSSFTLGRTGFSVTGTSLTVSADGYSLTYTYGGGISVSTDAYVVPSPQVPTASGGATVLNSSNSILTSYDASAAHKPKTPTAGVATLNPPKKSGPTGNWTPTGSLATARAYPATVTLKNGDVLVAGGIVGKSVVASAELYSPKTHTWSATGSLSQPEAGASAVLLPNGDVLLAGGESSAQQPVRTAELYDPSSGSWSSTVSLPVATAFASTASLSGGRVLVAGGMGAGHSALDVSEVYSSSSNTWKTGPSLAVARAFATATTLPNGNVLIAGGVGPSGKSLASAQIFNATYGNWTTAGTMTAPRFLTSAALLKNGDVLVVGDKADGDLYDPQTNTWHATEGMPTPRILSSLTTLPNGNVLVAGGVGYGHSIASSEVYNPTTGTWANAGQMHSARAAAGSVILSGGQVLEVGGATMTIPTSGNSGTVSLVAQSAAEVYAPVGTPRLPVPPAATVTKSSGHGNVILIVAVVLVAGAGFLVAYLARRRRLTATGEDALDEV